MGVGPLRWVRGACAAALAVATAGVGAGAAGAQEALPVVSIESGPTTPSTGVPDCTDALEVFDEATSFAVRRTGDTSTAIEVGYKVSGTAQPGVHYSALPGTVAIPAGAEEAVVDVDVLNGSRAVAVQLEITLAEGDTYTVGEPASVPIRFYSERDPSIPLDCDFFAFHPEDPANTLQVISVGEGLRSLHTGSWGQGTSDPAPGQFNLVAGTLPPGITLNADGSFAGVATAAGTTIATIEACSVPYYTGDCDTTELRVVVQPAGTELPRTGNRTVALVALAMVLLVVGASLGRTARSATR